MRNVESKLRVLARSHYWQNIYQSSKKCSGIKLFENESNLSGIQSSFLYWLSVYDMLYEELSQHTDDLLTEKVIQDDDRCDAYLIYRNKKHDHLWKQMRLEERMAEHRNRHKSKHKSGKMNLIDVDLRSQ